MRSRTCWGSRAPPTRTADRRTAASAVRRSGGHLRPDRRRSAGRPRAPSRNTKHVGNRWCAEPTYLRVAISASSTVGVGGACACTAAGAPVAITSSPPGAVILAPARQRHRQGRRLTERHPDRWRLDRRPGQTARVATVRGARRAIEPPIDDDPVVHAVACPRYRCDPNGVLPVVRRQGMRKNPRGARERTYDPRVSGDEQIRSDQHRERGATAQVPPHGSASAAVHPSAGETLPGSGTSTATTVSEGMLEDATDAANRAPLSIIAAASAVTTYLTSRCLKDRAGRVGRTTSWWWIEAWGAWRPFVLGLTGLPRRGGCDGCRPR